MENSSAEGNPSKKIVVVYRSKSGFTQKYAEWLAKALDADLRQGKKTKLADILPYDTIIYGGGLYAVGINGIKLITNNYSKLKDKKLVVFCTGASPTRAQVIDEVKNRNFTAEHQQKIKFFMLRGGFDYNKVTGFDKLLINILKSRLKKKKDLTPDERGMLNSYENPVDFTNEKNIEPILKYLGYKG